MKRILVIILTMLLVCSFTGCTTDETQKLPSEEPSSVIPPELSSDVLSKNDKILSSKNDDISMSSEPYEAERTAFIENDFTVYKDGERYLALGDEFIQGDWKDRKLEKITLEEYIGTVDGEWANFWQGNGYTADKKEFVVASMNLYTYVESHEYITIQGLTWTDETLKTARDIGIGDTYDMLMEKYPDPTENGSRIGAFYEDGDYSIFFELDAQNIIVSIEITHYPSDARPSNFF